MKRKNILIVITVILTMFFTSCNNTTQTTEQTALVDSQENCINIGMRCDITSSPDSYYYMRNNYLYVIDKKTHKCMPLCSKPDCLHDKRVEYPGECEAYFNGRDCVVYYDNFLYAADEDYRTDENGQTKSIGKIIRMNPDGSDKTDIFSTELSLWSFKIHRGNIYFTASEWTENNGANGVDAALYKVQLGGDKAEKIISFSEENIMNDVRLYGEHLYVSVLKKISESKNAVEFRTEIVHYDLTTGTLENITDKLCDSLGSTFTVFNDKLIISDDTKIYECDLNGENCREVIDGSTAYPGYDYYSVYSNDGENILINAYIQDRFERSEMIVCDKKYRIIKTCEMPFDCRTDVFCEPESMIVYANDKLYFVNKNKLGENDCAEEIYSFK